MQFYSPIIIKFALGIICLIVQINLMGKGNLAPTSAMDQVQNYVLGGIIGGVIYIAHSHTPRKTPLPPVRIGKRISGRDFLWLIIGNFSRKQQKQQTDDECIYLFII